MDCRTGEKLTTKPRNERFFCIAGGWYFSTREDLQIGPFPSKDQAEIEFTMFIRHIGEGGIYPELYKMRGSFSSRSLSYLSS